MRRLAMLCLLACEPRLSPRPLPELVHSPPAVVAVHPIALLLPAGESLIWEIEVGGVAIGRAELAVSEDDVRSWFTTNALASLLAPVRYDLATALDRRAGRPVRADEQLAIDSARTHSTAAFSGTHVAIDGVDHAAPAPVHTLHTALGWSRAWARVGAPPAVLYVLYGGDVVRVELAPPVRERLRERAALRLDARAGELTITLWLSDEVTRVPLRVVARAGTFHLVAELVASS